ncbi:CAP domain-containing protein [uncultured Ruminococcus sp.]|uniref:CAP domain-containing protein n=1 Tax=uncultured Ruminococcus sp. TaxID=165186 RepID=UPI000EC8AE68|nr:CAP domain-containing protein [uncultured Ruminococcus sp.]HCJ41026.1 CAP domain-containing protein [Ruminococcus sp.]
MNLKKIANAKNIVCLAVVLALGVGVYIAEKKSGGTPEPEKKSASSLAVSSKAEESSGEAESGKEKIILAAEIPERTCGAVDFGGNVVFADPKGSYSFLENGSSTSGITVKDDSGAEVVFSVEDGKLVLTREGQPATGFVFNKHMVELKEGRLYYDSSPVEYKATSFSAYRLNSEYVVECTAKGQYRLRNSKGEITNECTLKENTGASVKIRADESGFYTEGVDDGLFYNCYKLNGDILTTSWSYVLYINGEELAPYGYTDTYTDPSFEPDADKISFEPMDAPVNYGAVSTANEGITDLTAEMLGYVNEYRKQYDMPALYGLDELDAAAAVRAEELAQKFEHVRPDEKESSYNTVLISSGLRWWRCGENIAKGGDSCKEVFDSWISSEEHRALILDPDMKYMSLANSEDGGVTYWEMLMFNDTYVPTAEAE